VTAGPSERRLAREAARRSRARRHALVSVLSTVVVLGGLAAVIVTSRGWPTVREAFFSPGDFADAFPKVLTGFWTDVKLFLIVEVAVLVLGLAVALVRTSRGPALFPLRLIAAVYTDLFRGLPTILVVYLVGFGVPALALSGLPTNLLVLGGIALALCYGAYVAEVYRAGLESVHPSQRAAALALGLTDAQATRHVILPQAVRRVAPPLLNDFIALQKDVALVSILGPLEAFRVGQIEAASNFIYTPLVAAGFLYLCVTIPLTRYLDHIQRRQRLA
jgi:polar amino acid transport system permease protein